MSSIFHFLLHVRPKISVNENWDGTQQINVVYTTLSIWWYSRTCSRSQEQPCRSPVSLSVPPPPLITLSLTHCTVTTASNTRDNDVPSAPAGCKTVTFRVIAAPMPPPPPQERLPPPQPHSSLHTPHLAALSPLHSSLTLRNQLAFSSARHSSQGGPLCLYSWRNIVCCLRNALFTLKFIKMAPE